MIWPGFNLMYMIDARRRGCIESVGYLNAGSRFFVMVQFVQYTLCIRAGLIEKTLTTQPEYFNYLYTRTANRTYIVFFKNADQRGHK
jgi:hypothetical protein